MLGNTPLGTKKVFANALNCLTNPWGGGAGDDFIIPFELPTCDGEVAWYTDEACTQEVTSYTITSRPSTVTYYKKVIG